MSSYGCGLWGTRSTHGAKKSLKGGPERRKRSGSTLHQPQRRKATPWNALRGDTLDSLSWLNDGGMAVRRGTTLSHVELPGNPVGVLEGDITLIQCRVSLHARILDASF